MTLRLYFNRRHGGIDNQPKWAIHFEHSNEVRYFNIVYINGAKGKTESVEKRTTFNADHVLLFINADLEYTIDSVTIVEKKP